MHFPALLRTLDDSWAGAETTDVSATGSFLVADRPFLVSAPVEYVLTFPPDLTKAPNPLVRDPGTQRHAEMALAQRDHEIQAFAPHRSDQPFTIRICLWSSHWRAQNLQVEVILQLLVQLPREDRIAIVDQELIRMVARDGFAELLHCPGGGRMSRHVVVEDTPAADFHCEEDIEHLEPSRHPARSTVPREPSECGNIPIRDVQTYAYKLAQLPHIRSNPLKTGMLIPADLEP
jgi:hypothetical protein